MKKTLHILCLCLVTYIAKAQDQSEPQLFVGNAAVDYKSVENNLQVQMQVGNPIFSMNSTSTQNLTNIGFPYGVFYVASTFLPNEGLEISKGYYTDRVNIKWTLNSNQNVIEKINIYRKELGSATPTQLIGTVSKDVFEFDDIETQGGILYEYKIEAVGVSTIEEEYVTYITDVGFRNPTATVSGSISFDGGSPVQDAVVFAEANGVANNAGSSLQFTNGFVEINDIEYEIPTNALTLQTWVTKSNYIMSLRSTNDETEIQLNAGKFFSQSIGHGINIAVILNGQFYTLHLLNSYPTGELDNEGNDVFKNISSLTDTSFIHISLVLAQGSPPKYYLNGRELTQAYIDGISGSDGIPATDTEAAIAGVLKPRLSLPVFTDYNIQSTIDKVTLGQGYRGAGYTGYLDEVRVWKRALSAKEIRRDYRRYLSGGESDLSIYLRMDEKEGSNVYDFSKKGFRYNKNDGFLGSGVTFSSVTPTKKQLGVFGVTDANGSYSIASIGYSGTGESFVVTPSLGVHEFEPASQTVFLGAESSVVNQLNFKDISSFKFNGRAVYNVQGVFNSIALDADEAAYTDIEDFGYNQYKVTSNGARIIINKGQYYYEGGTINKDNNFHEGGTLKKYPVIGLEKASVYIDGNIVINADNQPVETDADGNFSITVPIGKHKIEVRKDGHTFAHTGFFPASNTFEFFESQISPRWFIDTTRISLIGRVVGGKLESEKPLGFGLEGEYNYLNNKDEENEETEIISSTNNIGVATIILKGNINTNTFDVPVSTNPITGEYVVSLIPHIYYIKTTDLKIPSNTALNGEILTSNETLNLLATPVLDSISYTTKDGTELFSEPFHHKKSFRYNAPVTLTLLDQDYDKEIVIGANTYDISTLNTPLYTQKKQYDITFEVSQNYVNKDASEDKITKEYFTEGTFNITNNLEIANKSTMTLGKNGKEYKYSFFAGEPNIAIADGFKKSISVQYNIPGSNALGISNADDFKSEGIIDGGAPTGGVDFASVAPDVPDIILRDPPGSNSFASIEKGTTITYTQEILGANTEAEGGGYYVSIGSTITVSTGIPAALVDTDVNIVIDTEGSFSKSIENTSENVTTNTYTFNKTISTSDDPNFVGASGDLYIGNAKNVYYGIFNNMFVTDTPLLLANGTPVPNIEIIAKNASGEDVTMYVSTRQDYVIGEQPTKTFYTYSQKYIIETLIPNLEKLAANFVEPPIDPNADPLVPVYTQATYQKQADLWRKIIQQNEKSKYDAKNNRDDYKQSVLESVKGFGEFESEITDLVNANFFSNQSFDAGVGEFTSEISSTQIVDSSIGVSVETSEEFKSQLGLLILNIGAVGNYTYAKSKITTSNQTSGAERTSTISYTLKDNDDNNSLSVDVVNMFDGNGPIFITRGGATSCPYEPETTSLFYKVAGFDEAIIGNGGEILSDPTNRVYLPSLLSDKTVLTNVPESEGALFTLFLKNNSETQSDLEYILDVDALTLNGATTNIAVNGVNVYIPYNETVEFPFEVYKSSASSIFKYDDIRVYLKNPCDEITASEAFVDVSVEFKKSCSKVTVSAPEDNFIFNRAEAYATDTNTGITTTNTLPITFTDFNTDFAGFNKIELQYRNASSANWIKLKTYYGSQALKDTASDDDGEVIDPTNSEYTFNWNVIANKIPDGTYEFRAISYCTDEVSYNSPIVSGTINLNAPVQFGTPQPTDGILDVGEDISLRFNEAIFKGDLTNIKVTGLSNQQEIDHSVSVYLDGGANQIELPNQILPNGSFTMQFWFKNATSGSGNLISQENGINASLNGDQLTFSLGGESVIATIDPSQYNFYSLVYQSGKDPQLLIFQNGNELENKVLTGNLDINSNSSIFIGGSNVIGNIHDLRFWSKTFTPAQATVAKDKTLTGRELNLLGYWTLDEGNGKTGFDKAKSRNAIVNLGWDIKPKGTAYTFANNAYLSLENVGFVQPSVAEDITLSFWIKTATATAGTIFSNGKGNDEDLPQSDGSRNKWSVNMKSDGNLELMSENISYNLTTVSVADGNWHHIAMIVKRGGSINTYVDALETASVSSIKIGGISGSKILIGARLFDDGFSNLTMDNHFTGSLDEIRLWNTARSFEQIKRDRYFEIEPNSEGLMLYVDFNQEDGNTTKGPKYNHVAINNTVTSTFSRLNAGSTQNYTQDSPALKPKLQFTNIPFSTVVNGDQMIIQPTLTDEEWSLYEGQILDFSVSRMNDTHFNEQLSPISWSALVSKQEIEWFTQNQTKEIVAEKNVNEAYSFTMDIVNKGGSNQTYSISGLPTWITADSSEGSVAPNAIKQLVFKVDNELAMGIYNADIYLETASGFNDRLTLSLRVITPAPDWSVNAPDYSNSLNIIGKIKINEIFSRDQFTKVGAFVNNTPRGEAYLQYDDAFDSYFVYLTAYSNVTSGEEITFKIWDALNGKVLVASIDGAVNTLFLQNEVLGSKSIPVVFSGAQFSEQTTLLNKGWTWASFFVEHDNFINIKETFDGLMLEDNDQIKSQNEFTRYENNDWFGSLTTLENTKMYKVKLANTNSLQLIGNDVDEANVHIAINEGWNWLAYPIHRNISLAEALANYNPTDGDVIKDQYNFAIYDSNSGWSGTLNYMQSNRGYMMKSGVAQTLNYPNANYQQKSNVTGQEHSAETIAQFAKYNANMSVISEIVADDEFEKVFVYDAEGVLRGASPIITLNSRKISFITVFSNTNDALKFVLSDGNTEVDVTSSVVFENNKVLGDLKNPVVLSLKSLSTENEFLSNVVLYPNPFSNTITINSSLQKDKVTKIEIFNTIGALVNTISTHKEVATIDTSNLAKGVYLMKLSASNGKSIIKKMIKK
ncbi:T9SS type A sorting domain-containing protein [Polaribacter litorisediminis]|uniref:LamG-like jellyroll fold domain-containing protein n=1 Tax=Polaribacter litorisediminis TaxID=1908341 RepID=UPI001CC0ED6E|nr:LamG-like jellyroll fold domain-containing protein [Polaribacter litorisediminis]UAM98358.1 T9SS type A sorting domain-containing protein [Polaribacter litorisediminis]